MIIEALNVIKAGVGMTISLGSGYVIGNVVRVVTPEGINTAGKVLMKVGAGAIGGVVGSKVAEHWDETYFEPFIEAVDDVVKKRKELKKEKAEKPKKVKVKVVKTRKKTKEEKQRMKDMKEEFERINKEVDKTLNKKEATE